MNTPKTTSINQANSRKNQSDKTMQVPFIANIIMESSLFTQNNLSQNRFSARYFFR